MKIVITGATGSLGRSLCEFLIGQNIEVLALGRNVFAGADLEKQGACFIQVGITETSRLKTIFADADIVVHAAGFASPWGPWEQFYEANVQGTESVIEALRGTAVKKLIYLSTPSLYFSAQPFQMITEDSALPSPINNYSKSKMQADEIVLLESKTAPYDTVLLRPRAFFGTYDTTILPRLLRMMKRGFFPLPDGGNAVVDVTAVENVIHFIWLVIQSNRQFKGEIYNISNGEPTAVKDLTRMIADEFNLQVKFRSVPLWVLTSMASLFELYANYITHKEPMMTRYAIQSLGITQTLSIKKAQDDLGYQPIMTLQQALRKLSAHQTK
jgi:2-alkyl-3-oxoalkanoate reductase